MLKFQELNDYCQQSNMILKIDFDFSKDHGKIEVIDKLSKEEQRFEKMGICIETMSKLMLSEIETVLILEKRPQEEAIRNLVLLN